MSEKCIKCDLEARWCGACKDKAITAATAELQKIRRAELKLLAEKDAEIDRLKAEKEELSETLAFKRQASIDREKKLDKFEADNAKLREVITVLQVAWEGGPSTPMLEWASSKIEWARSIASEVKKEFKGTEEESSE